MKESKEKKDKIQYESECVLEINKNDKCSAQEQFKKCKKENYKTILKQLKVK